jgi:phosphate/sulfate permease
MFGMLCALVIASVWLLTPTSLELPVSTAHTVVASIIEFSITAVGFRSISSGKQLQNNFISWVLSPTLTSIIAFIFFGLTKQFFVNRAVTFQRAMQTFPIVIFVGIAVSITFILLKAKKKISEK